MYPDIYCKTNPPPSYVFISVWLFAGVFLFFVIVVAWNHQRECVSHDCLSSTLFLVHYAFFAGRFSDSSASLFQVLVWHTRTEKPHLANEPKHRKDTVAIEVWSGLPVISWLRLPAALCFPLPFGLIQSAGDGQSLWGAAWFKTPCCLSNMLCENWIAPNTFYKLEWPRLFISSHPQPADVKSKCY